MPYCFQARALVPPAPCSRLSYLRLLDLSYNHLVGLPLALGHMHHLRSLSVRANHMDAFPYAVLQVRGR